MEIVHNTTNEMMLVGSIYRKPDLLIEYGQYIKSKYDFFDEAAKFFYDCAEVIYKTRSQSFTKTIVVTFMAENEERLHTFKEYGGNGTLTSWMKLADPDAAKGYYEVVKKFSLLREYQRNGFDIEKIMQLKDFETYTATDIYRMIRSKADRINTVILTNTDGEILNSNIQSTINSCLESPDMGLTIPYPILNDLFRGFKTKSMMCVGMLSNAGKSRFMFKLISYIALVKKEKVLVLLNEMTVDEMRFCLITTVINNPEFQDLHGVKLTKNEREITLGLYRDEDGNFIYRRKNADGEFIESVKDYTARVEANSEEYRKVIAVSKWVEEKTQGIIFAKDVSQAYDDKTLEFEIRKSRLTQGTKYCFYDTLKSDLADMGDWAAFKATATKLSELAKQLDIFVYGSIQLGDEAEDVQPDRLYSKYIAASKQIKHVLHTMILFKEIPSEMIRKYGYLAPDLDWGTPSVHDLDEKKRYYAGVVDKNRFGSKKKLIFEIDLNTNVWTEIGELVRK